MASVFEEVVARARRLSEPERMRLVEALLRDSAAHAGASPEVVADAWDAEIDRRLDEMESGPVAWVSHEQTMAGAAAAIASARAK